MSAFIDVTFDAAGSVETQSWFMVDGLRGKKELARTFSYLKNVRIKMSL